MPDAPTVFISFTNQDQRDKDLARFLAVNLEARGAKVCKAPEKLEQDKKWRPQLAANITNSTHFLVILSAASIASEEVLKELRQAKKRADADPRFGIMQVRAGQISKLPPAAKFLGDYQWTPYGTNEAILDAVSKTLNLRPRVRLSPVTQAIIDSKTRDFVGRDYVFEEIDRFQANNVSGYLTIVADPGMGKSSVLAEFVRRTGALAHFNVRQEGITSAAKFLDNICSQLIGLADLPYPALPPNATADGAFLQQLLREVHEKLKARIVIAVDALDEVDLANHPPGANILFLPTTLPERVYFILTRRPLYSCKLDAAAAQGLLDLMEHPEENKADIAAYLEKAALRPKVQEWIQARGLTVAGFVSKLVERSASNFMYIVHVLFDVESGVYNDSGPEQLPNGLKGYYSQHWERMGMEARPAPLAKLRIIGVVAVARQPLSRKLITRFVKAVDASVDEIAVAQVLEEWKQFLHESQGPSGTLYSIYHASFLDFLFDKIKDNPALPGVDELQSMIRATLKQSLTGGP